jgi:anti-anti-sigma factor
MTLRLNELLPLRVHIEIDDERAILRLIGPIAVRDVETLLSALEQAEASGAGEIVVDLRQVSILGSRGVSVLLTVAKRLAPGRRLVLARPCEIVRRVCDLTGLSRFVVMLDQLPPGLEPRPDWADNL